MSVIWGLFKNLLITWSTHIMNTPIETPRNKARRDQEEWLHRIQKNREMWISAMGRKGEEESGPLGSPSELGKAIRTAQEKLDKMRENDVRIAESMSFQKKLNEFIWLFTLIGVSGIIWSLIVLLFSLGGPGI